MLITVFDEKKKLAVFDRHSPYLATKKIGKNNPRAEQIKTDNWARTEWNRTVDRALVEGISREEVLQVKREEITGKVQESVHRWGNRPWFFFSIVTHAIDVLSAMIKKIREQFQRMVALFETDGKNTAPVENLKSVAMVEPFVQGTEEVSVPAEADIAITSPKPELEPESKEEMTKLPEIILSPEIKGMDVSDSIATPKENESSSLKSQKDSIPPRPEFSMGMEKYDRLQEIYKKLVRQENIVLICEKELKQLRKELLLCTGVFQGKPRKELQRQITVKKQQMADAKQRLGDIVRGYGYLSVDNFMGMYRKTETDYADYTKRLKEWGDKYGMRYIKQQFEENIKSYPHPQKSKNSR